MALQLSPRQISTLERLVAAGFRPIAIPPYESALCMRKGECAVVLAPVPNGGLKVLAPASYLVDGNFGVRLKRETVKCLSGRSRRFLRRRSDWKS